MSKASGWAPPGPRRMFAGRNILPRAHAPLRTFMVAMAVMCFLAAMATGGMFATWRAIDDWKAGVVSEATAQVLPGDDGDEAFAARVKKALEFLKAAPGVRQARLLSRAESRRLVEPWLGRGALVDELPLPRIIALRLDREKRPDIEALNEALGRAVPDARVEEHGHWVLQLSDMARTASWLGVAILAGIAAAAVVLVAFSARAALESNRETLEVLHLIGAQDRFIARQVERRFLRAGFLSALAGVGAAFIVFLLLAFAAPSEGIRAGVRGMLFAPWPEGLRIHAAWIVIVLVATVISLASARMAVIHILHEMFHRR